MEWKHYSHKSTKTREEMKKIINKKTKQAESLEDIETVIKRYKDMVYRIALVRVKNSWDADDVFQEVFITYCRKKPMFFEEEHRKAWLIKTTMNLAKKSALSIWKKRVDVVEDMEQLATGIFEFQEPDESNLFQVIRELPEKYQTVLVLFYFEEMSTKEMAEFLSIREGTVRMRLMRAREKMKEKLEGKG